VAWVATRDGLSDVYLAAAAPGGGFAAAPVRVNDRPGDAAPHEQAPAQVAVGPRGRVYVLWQRSTKVPGRRFPASDLRLAVSADGGRTFQPALTVNDDAGGLPSSHTFHDLIAGADGSVYVSWIDSRVRDRLRAARLHAPAAERPGGGGGPPAGHGGASHPRHGAGAADDGLPGPEIRVARSTDGGRTFAPSVVVASDACPCCRTSLAAGPDGSLYLAWRQVFAGDVRDVVVARAEPGTLRFGTPVRVHEDGWVFPGCPHAGPSVAVDRAGGVHVAWYTGREGRQGLWYAASPDGGRSFGAPRALVSGAWVPPSQARLATAGDRVWATWDDRRGKQKVLSLATMDSHGRAHPVLQAPHAGIAPAIGVRGSQALLAWLDGQAVRTQWIGAGSTSR
jgi:hypothetical protein